MEEKRRVPGHWWSGLNTSRRNRALAIGALFLGLAGIAAGGYELRTPLGWLLLVGGFALSGVGFAWDRGIRRALGLDNGWYG